MRFELLPHGDRFFTYARCHPEDHFKKEVARRVADRRAEDAKTDPRILNAMRGLPDDQNTDLMVHAVIRKCRNWQPPADTHQLVINYMTIEWRGFADALETLYYANLAQERRGEVWKDVVSELFRRTYSEYGK